jgi:hypothetical protein
VPIRCPPPETETSFYRFEFPGARRRYKRSFDEAVCTLVVVFRIDAATGALHPTGQVVEVPRPVCVKFMPAPGADH